MSFEIILHKVNDEPAYRVHLSCSAVVGNLFNRQPEKQRAKLTYFKEEAHAQHRQDNGENGYDGDGEDVRVAEKEVLRVVAQLASYIFGAHDY